MIVKLIAATKLWDPANSPVPEWTWQTDGVADADDLAEFAGRACYESWGKPNPKTATNEGYIDHIIEVQHTSVLEHASATIYVAEVTRSLLMELRTHRHLSFSAISQRYVNHAGAAFVENPLVARAAHRLSIPLGQLATDIKNAYTAIYEELRAEGYGVKQAREAARTVLPNAVEAKFVATGNMHAWRYVLAKRRAAGADAEMQEFAIRALEAIREAAPHSFQDM